MGLAVRERFSAQRVGICVRGWREKIAVEVGVNEVFEVRAG